WAMMEISWSDMASSCNKGSRGPPRLRRGGPNVWGSRGPYRGPLKHDDAAGQLAGGERAECLVGLVEPVAAVDQLVDLPLAGLVERGQPWEILARARAAVGAAADHALGRHDRPHVERHRGA